MQIIPLEVVGKSTKNLFIFSILVSIDQFAKYLIRLKGGFYICNEGVSWGIRMPDVVFWITWGIFVLALLIFFIFSFKISNFQFLSPSQDPAKTVATSKQIPNSFYTAISINLILAGALANAIDRVLWGCVIDFIDLKFWPVFNLADIFIVSGAIILLVRWKKI